MQNDDRIPAEGQRSITRFGWTERRQERLHLQRLIRQMAFDPAGDLCLRLHARGLSTPKIGNGEKCLDGTFVRLEVKLKSKHAIVEHEGLVLAGVRSIEPGRTIRNSKRVLMPMKDSHLLR